MNKTIMFFWGLIVFAIWGFILFVGFKNQDKEYLKLSNSLKHATSNYIEDKKIDLGFNESYKVYLDDLIENNYIKKSDELKEYCIDSIVVSKGLIKDDYKIIKECKNIEIE